LHNGGYVIIHRFLFRCDVSPALGTGHLRRCMTLAQELKHLGAFVFFLCRAEGFDLGDMLRDISDEWEALDWGCTPESDAQEVIDASNRLDSDIVIIDHYRADEKYQQQLYSASIRWLQFDGFVQQPLWADWVINTNPIAKESDYLVRKQRDDTRLLLGPAYALLRREFLDARPQVRVNDKVRQILLTFGGGDDRGATRFCLDALSSLDPAIERVVLIGSASPQLPVVKDWTERNKKISVRLSVDAPDVAKHMIMADLAIIAGGTTTFEVAAMGLPALIVQIADNQVAHAAAWENTGALRNAGPLDSLMPEDMEHQVIELINDKDGRRSMAIAGMALVDCLGAQRVAQVLMSEVNSVSQ